MVQEVEAAMTQKRAVHVATPAYDGKVDQEFASSMLMAGQLATTNYIEVSCSIMGNGAFIELARNVLVKKFLEDEELSHFTHFMFIDADVSFEPRALAGLVRADWPVSAGAYRRRQEPEDYPLRWIPKPGTSDRLWMEGDWLKCDRVATGFLCIRRDVLEIMTQRCKDEGRMVRIQEHGEVPWLFYTKIDEERRFEGEDFCWCDDYMKLVDEGVFDHPIMVWPDFDFVHGGYPCNFFKWLEKNITERKDKRRKGKRK